MFREERGSSEVKAEAGGRSAAAENVVIVLEGLSGIMRLGRRAGSILRGWEGRETERGT